MIADCLDKLESELQKPESHNQPKNDIPQLHLESLQQLPAVFGENARFFSNSTCLCCICNIPEHPLPCGHVVFTSCVGVFGKLVDDNIYVICSCPFACNQESHSFSPVRIYYKPTGAGVRILCLDG